MSCVRYVMCAQLLIGWCVCIQIATQVQDNNYFLCDETTSIPCCCINWNELLYQPSIPFLPRLYVCVYIEVHPLFRNTPLLPLTTFAF